MQILQKSLMVIIMVQVLVFAQLSFIKFGNGNTYYSLLKNPFNFGSQQTKQEKELLITSLRGQVKKKLHENIDFQLINNCLNLLATQRIKHLHKSRGRIHKYVTPCHNNICNRVEHNAKRFLGYRYVWGATGPNKFDCSGFTQKVFKISGINLPRVSREQAKVGKYISFNSLRKGDMVFFDTKHRKTGKVNHVGIYLEDGKFIHASSGGKRVMITNFKQKAFYKNRFLWGRRIVKG